MSNLSVRLSALTVEQLHELPQKTRRQILKQVQRLAIFPESAPIVPDETYFLFRQLMIGRHRVIYRYFMDEYEVRVYCVIHQRRRLPSADFLTHQQF